MDPKRVYLLSFVLPKSAFSPVILKRSHRLDQRRVRFLPGAALGFFYPHEVLAEYKEVESGDFVCCDNPHATRLTIHILADLRFHQGRGKGHVSGQPVQPAHQRGSRKLQA